MISAIRWLLGLFLTLVLAAFAALNRDDVSITWNPISEPETLPAYVLILSSFVVGFILGGIIVWLNGGQTRKAKRKQNKEIKRLEKELAHTKEDKFIPSAPAPEIFPALPSK